MTQGPFDRLPSSLIETCMKQALICAGLPLKWPNIARVVGVPFPMTESGLAPWIIP